MNAAPVNHRREVTGVVFLAFAIILGVSYYLPPSATGMLGVLLKSLGKGLFGISAYAIPVLFMYAAIDYFIEKRTDVAPRRVKSVLLVLLAASALFPVFTVDREIIKALCIDVTGHKSLASTGFSILWKSGIDAGILKSAASGNSAFLTGGVVGGGIAIALETIAAKTGAAIILTAFVVSQAVLIFNVSLSRTAARTAQAIKTSTYRASGAIRSGAQSLRAFSQQVESRPYDELPMDAAINYPDMQSGNSRLHEEEISPFNEPDAETHQGFIDFEGTSAPMSASSHRVYNPYDVDLSNPPPMRAKPREKPFEPAETMVETDFIRLPQEPLPTSQAHAVSEMPDFLRDKEESTWLDIQMNTANPTEDTITHIPIRRIGVDGFDVHTNRQEEYDDSSDELEEPGQVPVTSRTAVPSDASSMPIAPSSDLEHPPVLPAEEPRSNAFTVTARQPSSSGTAPEKSKNRQIALEFPKQPYKVAPASLLMPDIRDDSGRSNQAALVAQGKKLEDTLASFGVAAKVVNITHGPAITRFELTPGPGIKVSRIVNLTDDLALAMAAVGVRIEAPIPGKSAIGIEIPNPETTPVTLRSLIDSPGFKKNTAPLVAALGRDIPGNPIFCDLAKMPHLLIAGATGSGKSVCINSILISILCKATPDQVKLIMIDPKVVELSIYNGIPHLLAPVVTDPKKASNTLNWAVGEMTRRYGLFAETSVRDFRGYNEELSKKKEPPLPLILIVIDELADLMQVASKEVEESIARLTAMARAAGIHLLIATQRPSVDVITGVIKANIPSRIAFAVASQVDSRTILDMGGAEKLLGKGDMLYYPQSAAKPQRGQGAFVTDAEVESVIEYLKAQNMGTYDPDEAEAIISAAPGGLKTSDRDAGDDDELLPQAVEIIIMAGCASVSILQRRMNIGYPRAARLIDRMQEKGYVGPFEGSKPRKLLISQSQWLEIQAKGG